MKSRCLDKLTFFNMDVFKIGDSDPLFTMGTLPFSRRVHSLNPLATEAGGYNGQESVLDYLQHLGHVSHGSFLLPSF